MSTDADPIATTIRRHRAGEGGGLPSICSAHPTVLTAAARQAVADGSVLLVEATSNQVDQFGGYTGMVPADFRDLVARIAAGEGLPADRLVLGGDHLGPNRWQRDDPATAMTNAVDLVTAYVEAGYAKIHLDCSMPLAGEPTPLDDTTVAARAARLLDAAERAATGTALEGRIRYVIGTEVPVPGGASHAIDTLAPTPPDAARATLAAHREAFAAAGHADVWPRVMALVVQPGVEFDALRVVDYDPAGTTALQRVLDDEPDLVFEAHSTDYQLPESLAALVRNGWAVLKVGPGLTFALREALFALSVVERELVPEAERADLPGVIERRMLAEPGYWERYYPGTPDEQRIARRYSWSDRLRYYWPDPAIAAAEERLLTNLERTGVPLPLLSQVLPDQYRRVRRGELAADPRELVIDKVRDALRPYAAACRPHPNGAPS
ncbi:D-tagatose-bisphosphate aldolase, class II, non-catalytic subunit [Amnibacterium sp.]|uniref:D-tagatose-bisphosphate aldolase, class II, non-catalytic subunit n=1 Tax=Amnibacterium sp. TaxID=1872496 RepID=UPI00260EB034|nr:D-tagatose-bisphosphate aldolase, class II, non-catalytic subunit [Amnibacterium sp.]MCU1474041.1 D-tagatose-bisphosphate aldolase, class non-catalytic subunit [Amnibacterium sp.]